MKKQQPLHFLLADYYFICRLNRHVNVAEPEIQLFLYLFLCIKYRRIIFTYAADKIVTSLNAAPEMHHFNPLVSPLLGHSSAMTSDYYHWHHFNLRLGFVSGNVTILPAAGQ